MISSGSLTGLVGIYNTSQVLSYKEMGAIEPMTKYLENNETWNSLPVEMQEAYLIDGEIWALPMGDVSNMFTRTMRKDWLDNLGLEAPTTLDELCLVCNAHIDPAWLWPREEGIIEALSTFETAERLLNEHDFIFNHNEAMLYAWVEQYDPALFERIRSKVREGKWNVMGGWYLQPDCNMPSGEAILRQVQEGRRYFASRFPVQLHTAINFDSFGHSRGLVQILAKCGYDSYIVCRPGMEDFETPDSDFIWKGFDGSEVLVHRVFDGYESGLGRVEQKIRAYAEKHPYQKTGLCLWGVGNHGGGPSEADLAQIDAMQREGMLLKHCTPEQFFDAVRAEKKPLATVCEAMNHWGVGCYTSQIRVKQRYRRLESAFFQTEKMAAHAWRIGAHDYPEEALAEVQRDMLYLQFHDILPGSGVEAVEEQALRVADAAFERLRQLRFELFMSMTWGRVSATSPVVPVYVYNPHPFPVEMDLEYELKLPATVREGFAEPVLTCNGEPVPVQAEREDNLVPIQWRRKFAFRPKLQPGAMHRFEFTTRIVPERPARGQGRSEAGQRWFEGKRLRAAFDEATGWLSWLEIDGHAYVKSPSCRLVVFEDRHDAWGMTFQRFDRIAGEFTAVRCGDGQSALRVVEDGDVRTIVECIYEYGRSRAVMRYLISKLGAALEMEIRLQFAEELKMVKLAVSPAMEQFEFLGETMFGTQTLRQDLQEEVAQRWLAMKGNEGRCLTLINDSTYGSSCDGKNVYQSLVRSCGYAAHPMKDRQHVPDDRYVPCFDQHEVRYRFALQGGDAAERMAAVTNEAILFHERPEVMASFHGKCAVSRESAWEVENPSIVLTAVQRQAENGKLHIRLFNPLDVPQKTAVRVGALRGEAAFGPYEFKTLEINDEEQTIRETSVL